MSGCDERVAEDHIAADKDICGLSYRQSHMNL